MVYILMVLILFQAISALPSALLLIIKPSGQLLGKPLSHLEHAPFNNFLIPGLFLFIVLGIAPLLTFIGLIKPFSFRSFEILNIYKKHYWAWTFSYYIWNNTYSLDQYPVTDDPPMGFPSFNLFTFRTDNYYRCSISLGCKILFKTEIMNRIH